MMKETEPGFLMITEMKPVSILFFTNLKPVSETDRQPSDNGPREKE